MSIVLSKTNSFINERVFYLKRLLSILLAALMVMSCFSALTVTSFAAAGDVFYEYKTPETLENEDPADDIVEWQLIETAVVGEYVLRIHTNPSSVAWSQYTADIVGVELALDNDVTAIPAGAFKGYPKLKSADFNNAISSLEIGGYAFANCDALTRVIIPGAMVMGDYAFYDCDELTYVFIGGGLGTVGENVFKSCDKLADVDLKIGCYNIGYGMFEDCKALTEIELPDDLRSIGELAFYNCKSLSEIYIPDSVIDVGRYAFHNCSSATTLYVGHKAENIGEYAFHGCTALTDVEIACAMRVINEGLFMDCTSLANISIEQSVETIGKNAFKNCVALTTFDIPITVKTIGDTAFAGTGLTSVKIPAEVTEIAKGAFTGCSALSAVDVDVYNDKYYSVDGIVYDMALSTVVMCPAGKSGDIVVKDGTQTIADDAFINCNNITSVSIPSSVTNIAYTAFSGCVDTVTIKTKCTAYANEYAIERGIKTELTHEASKWQQTLAPNCIDKGTKELVCEGCGFVYETSDIEPLGHNYDSGVVTTKATCDTDGEVTFTCTRDNCGDFYTNVIPATNHKMDNGEMIVPVTCTTDGTKRFKCTNDGCYYYNDVTVTATGHKYDKGAVTTEATCTVDGVKTFTCQNTDCGHTYTEPVAATGHSYNNGVVTIAATCTVDGVMTYTCQNSGCGDSYTDVIPAIGHNYVSTLTKKSTCTVAGVITHICANCGDTYTTDAPLADHQLHKGVTVEPTCTKDGITGDKCAICNQFFNSTTIPATGHSYDSTTGMCHCGASNGQGSTTPGGSTVVTPVNPGSGKTEIDTPKMISVKNYGSGESSGIQVKWQKVDGAVKYRLYRRTTGQSWKLYDTVTSTTYVDKNATAGKSWRYTVRAVATDGTLSGYESGLYVRRVLTPHLVSISNTVNGITIKWEGVKPANSYRIYRKVVGGEWKYIGTSETTSYTDKKAVSGTKYIYTVKAVSTGTSAHESGLKITCVATPELNYAKNISDGVKISWGKVSGADSYVVYRKGNAGWYRIATGVKTTSYVDKSAKDGKTYKYTVRAVDGGEFSAYESGVSIKVK